MPIVLPDEAATMALGQQLAKSVTPGLLFFLQGDLGAGKTTLTRALLRGLGVTGRVKSPSYALVEPYELADFTVYHFDLYRFGEPREWFDAGFDEMLNSSSVVIIEWPEKAEACLPVPDIVATLTPQGEGRFLQLNAYTTAGIKCLTPFNTPTTTSTS